MDSVGWEGFFFPLFYNFFLMATCTQCVYRTKAVAIGPGLLLTARAVATGIGRGLFL